ncbi:MAG: hypothetical protein ABJZ55_16840 [Fuerstiella sp.]
MTELSRRRLCRHSLAAFTLLGALVAVGCSEQNSDLASVTGTVRLNGEPLPDTVIEFSPTGSTGSISMGITDSSGNYEMLFTMSQKGASLGENLVRITTSDAGIDGIKQLVPAKYNTKSDLLRVVEPGANSFDFEIVVEQGETVDQVKDTDS